MGSADWVSRDIVLIHNKQLCFQIAFKGGSQGLFQFAVHLSESRASMENRELRGIHNMGVSVMRDENLTLEDLKTSHFVVPKSFGGDFFVFIRTDQARDTGNKYGGCCLL